MRTGATCHPTRRAASFRVGAALAAVRRQARRTQGTRMAKKALKQGNPKQFVGVLVVVAVLGFGGLGYALTHPGAAPITVDPTIPAGAAEAHVLGNASAPVKVLEFGDFECPGCGSFANVTEPDDIGEAA